MPSLYQLHVQEWRDCKRCNLSETREKVVLGRGSIPAQVCFVGEAPGYSEDEFGIPFVGPSGHLLDRIIDKSMRGVAPYTYAISNLLGCIPKDETGRKVKNPSDVADCVITCSPRLQQFVKMVDPVLIVCLGSEATDWLTGLDITCIHRGFHRRIPTISLLHPAYILRQNYAQQVSLELKQVVKLKRSVEEVRLNPDSFLPSLPIVSKPREKYQKLLDNYEDDIPF
jgi:uracil-DNA glycosylase family 4